MREELDASRQADALVEDNNRNLRSRTFCNPHGVMLIETAHPAIADWRNPATDTIHFVEVALTA